MSLGMSLIPYKSDCEGYIVGVIACDSMVIDFRGVCVIVNERPKRKLRKCDIE